VVDRDPIACATLAEAAGVVIRQGLNFGPSISKDGEVLVEVEYRYIPGDCYEPVGFAGKTPEARLELMVAKALRDLSSDVAWKSLFAKDEVRRSFAAIQRQCHRGGWTSTGKARRAL
jgi:hypothetical protein